MAAMGWCPSGRLFEAAACGAAVLSDTWEGLDQFFEPGREILTAGSADEAIDALSPAAGGDPAGGPRRPRARRSPSTRRSGGRRRWWTRGSGARMSLWGIVPAAGVGSRIQPLAFSKELLPVGSRHRRRDGAAAARSPSTCVERMILAGATRSAFAISPGKSDIVEYYGGSIGPAPRLLRGAARARGAVRRPVPRPPAPRRRRPGADRPAGHRLVPRGRPRPARRRRALLPPLPRRAPGAVRRRGDGRRRPRPGDPGEAAPGASTSWIWGAFRMPAPVFRELHALWRERGEQDVYVGTLVNAWLARGGEARGVRAGESYVDVGTLNGYREALQLLAGRPSRPLGGNRLIEAVKLWNEPNNKSHWDFEIDPEWKLFAAHGEAGGRRHPGRERPPDPGARRASRPSTRSSSSTCRTRACSTTWTPSPSTASRSTGTTGRSTSGPTGWRRSRR